MDKVKNIDELSFKEDYNHCDHIVANAALLLGSLLFWFFNSDNWSLFPNHYCPGWLLFGSLRLLYATQIPSS